MPGALSRPVDLTVVRTGLTRLGRSLSRSRVLVLAYHNIVPEGAEDAGDPSLHLPEKQFARQLDLLVETHTIVPLQSALTDAWEPNRPRAVITFDDAYRGAVTVGIDEIVRREIPATVFVTPAFVDGRSFWWDALAR